MILLGSCNYSIRPNSVPIFLHTIFQQSNHWTSIRLNYHLESRVTTISIKNFRLENVSRPLWFTIVTFLKKIINYLYQSIKKTINFHWIPSLIFCLKKKKSVSKNYIVLFANLLLYLVMSMSKLLIVFSFPTTKKMVRM